MFFFMVGSFPPGQRCHAGTRVLTLQSKLASIVYYTVHIPLTIGHIERDHILRSKLGPLQLHCVGRLQARAYKRGVCMLVLAMELVRRAAV